MGNIEAILNADIYSNFRNRKGQIKYGSKGERVEVISDRGNVLIVEGINGRFPVNKSETTEVGRYSRPATNNASHQNTIMTDGYKQQKLF